MCVAVKCACILEEVGSGDRQGSAARGCVNFSKNEREQLRSDGVAAWAWQSLLASRNAASAYM